MNNNYNISPNEDYNKSPHEDINLMMDDKSKDRIESQQIKINDQTKTSNDEKVSILNISNTHIDEVTIGLLEKGLNFAISPRTIPKEDILCSIEYGIKDMPDNIKEIIRQDCSIINRKAKPPRSNISKQEYLALKTLNQNPDILVLKAYKGGATVIMNTQDYNEKMLDHLTNSGCYIKLKKNPIRKISKNVNNLVKLSNEHNMKNLIETKPYTPRIYGAPKIHK